MEHTNVDSGKISKSKPTWIPRRDRIWVYVSILFAILVLAIGIWDFAHRPATAFHTRVFKSQFKNYGSLTRIGLFFVLANYVLLFALQMQLLNRWSTIKKGFVILLRFARRWHAPIAILSIGLILLHVIGAFLYGFTIDFSNISGLLALLVLLPVPVSGLLRYRRMDRKWHLRLGLGFAVLFFIHAFL